jgi:negative regulator of sigma E activity
MTHVHLHHKISALVDGELHGSARYRALHHIGRCEGCRHELEATLALKRRMSGLSDVEPSADLFASLDSATVAGRRSRCPRASQAPPARAVLRPIVRRALVGAGSLTVAVLSLAYAVGGPADVTTTLVTPPVDEYMADFAGDTGLAPLADPAADVLAADPEPAAQVLGRPGSTTTDIRPSGSTGTEARAERVLRRAMAAPDRFAYTGIREVDSFDAGAPTMLRLRVHHAPRQGTSFAVVDRPAGATATFVAQSEAVASGGLTSEPLQQLERAYDLSVASASSSVLGRPATVVEASRGGTVEARFWIDHETGLLLRRVMYASGRVVRSSAFTRLTVSRVGFLPHLPPELEAPSTTELAKTSAPLLGDHGWTCPPRLGRFGLTRLDRLETDANVMSASYSDGLSNVSVFEQRGSLQAGSMPGLSRRTMRGTPVYIGFGLPTVAVWGSGGTVYTVVTDAPDDTATAVVAALPHARPAPVGAGQRLATGLKRLAGTLDSVAR